MSKRRVEKLAEKYREKANWKLENANLIAKAKAAAEQKAEMQKRLADAAAGINDFSDKLRAALEVPAPEVKKDVTPVDLLKENLGFIADTFKLLKKLKDRIAELELAAEEAAKAGEVQ